MKELLAVNGNLFHINNANNEEEIIYEVVILTSETKYDVTNGGNLIRKRGIEEHRFFVRDIHLEKLTKELLELRKLKDN